MTILWKLGIPYVGRWVTILGMVGDQLRDGG